MSGQKNIGKKKTPGFLLLPLFYFIVLVAVTDFVVGKTLSYFYAKQTSGNEYATRYAAEETKADMLILGASRAQQQYNPIYFQDSLNLSCYNAGRDGTPLFYHYAILQSALKRYTPKIIILDCEFWSLKKTATAYERLSSLLPLYSSHPEMQDVINLRGPFEKYKLISGVYPYNSMLFKIAVGNLKKNDSNQYINGYVPLKNTLTGPVKTYYYLDKYEIDTVKTNMLRSLISDCTERNIKLYFVCPPYYMKTIGTDYSLAVMQQVATETNTPFLDYSQDTMYFNNPQLFDDTVHLNMNGSRIFCADLASKLKKK